MDRQLPFLIQDRGLLFRTIDPSTFHRNIPLPRAIARGIFAGGRRSTLDVQGSPTMTTTGNLNLAKHWMWIWTRVFLRRFYGVLEDIWVAVKAISIRKFGRRADRTENEAQATDLTEGDLSMVPSVDKARGLRAHP